MLRNQYGFALLLLPHLQGIVHLRRLEFKNLFILCSCPVGPWVGESTVWLPYLAGSDACLLGNPGVWGQTLPLKTERTEACHHVASSPSQLTTCHMAEFIFSGSMHWINEVEELQLRQVLKITRSLDFLSRIAQFHLKILFFYLHWFPFKFFPTCLLSQSNSRQQRPIILYLFPLSGLYFDGLHLRTAVSED